MKTFRGKVENGMVKIPPAAHVDEGARVFVAVLDDAPDDSDLPPYPPDLEAEDVAFVQACRGRLAKQLRDEEA
jgi:hypothetical protein